MKLINFISPGKLKLFLAECKKIFAPISHIHKTSDIENLDENLNNKYDKTAVQTQGTVLAAPSDKDGIADFRKLTKEDIGLGDVAQIVHLTKAEYKELEKKGQLNPDIDYATTDESDNITDSSVQLWNTSSSLAQQGKYLSYSDQNGGKYLSLMNSSDNTAVAHAKLMDGESGEGMDVGADKVKTVDSKGILVEALGETTAQALIDEVAKRVLDLSKETNDLTGRMTTAEESITSLNSEASTHITVIDSSKIPNYKTGTLCYLTMGKLVIIICQALGFTDQIVGFKERTLDIFPRSINNVLINSSCISGNQRDGEIFICGTTLTIRTFTTSSIFGTICYLTA